MKEILHGMIPSVGMMDLFSTHTQITYTLDLVSLPSSQLDTTQSKSHRYVSHDISNFL